MNAIGYEASPLPVRAGYSTAHQRFWQRLARPGDWFGGAQRVAIGREIRHAWACDLCRRRKAALSPAHADGAHDTATDLPNVVVDVVHRVVTDPGRLTRAWFDGVMAQGLTPEAYVEIIGTLVALLSIDEFCRGIGVPLHPLPEPVAGEPRRYRPAAAITKDAWVPMIPEDRAAGAEADLWERGKTGNVIRAMSVVPDEVRTLLELSAEHYVPEGAFMVFSGKPHGTLTRVQMEVIAGRVSALNGCFY